MSLAKLLKRDSTGTPADRPTSGKPKENLWKRATVLAKASALLDAQQIAGKAYSWGASESCQLGHGDANSVISARVLDDLRGLILKSIACGGRHSAAVTEEGALYTWGANEQGQLGNGSRIPCPKPTRIAVHLNKKFVQVACGEAHTIALTDNGQVYVWGSSELGQLGLGDSMSQLTPRLLEALQVHSLNIAKICCGAGHSLAITDDGRVYVWGWGVHGQLGLGDLGNQHVPRWLEYLQGKNVTAVAAGEAHSLALTAAGEIYSWGSGEDGRLGHTAYGTALFPGVVQASFGARVACIAAGDEFTLAVTEVGEVWSWGRGLEGQLGTGQTRNETRPVKVVGLQGRFITDVTCGDKHVLAVTEDGTLLTWGLNLSHQLGLGLTTNPKTGTLRVEDEYRPFPCIVPALQGKKLRLIAAGGDSSFAVVGGSIHLPTNTFCVGEGCEGALGIGTAEREPILQPVNMLDGHKVLFAAAGVAHTAVVTEDGQLWTWGKNETGALGVPNIAQGSSKGKNAAGHNQDFIHLQPVLVKDLVEKKKVVIHVACGAEHTLCVTDSKNVFAFGYNFHGELGLGHKDHIFAPELVRHLEGRGAVKVYCGWNFSAALTDTNDLFTWGSGGFGQLGHDVTDDEMLPRNVKALIGKQISQVSLGRCHTAALAVDGTVYTWGLNNNGQLGHGDTTMCTSPRMVSFFMSGVSSPQPGSTTPATGYTRVIEISCGASHTCALTELGDLYTWGYGNSGRLGHGDSKDINLPTKLEGFASRKIEHVFTSCTAFHTFAVDDGGILYGWGAGKHGQLSSGKEENEKAPVVIRALGTLKIRLAACGARHSCVVIQPALTYSVTNASATSVPSKRPSSQGFDRPLSAKGSNSRPGSATRVSGSQPPSARLSRSQTDLAAQREAENQHLQHDMQLLKDQVDRMRQRNGELRDEIESMRITNMHLTGAKMDDLPLDSLDQLKDQFLKNFGKIEVAKETIIKSDMKEKEKQQMAEVEKIYTEMIKRMKASEKQAQELLTKIKATNGVLQEKIRVLSDEIGKVREETAEIDNLKMQNEESRNRIVSLEEQKSTLGQQVEDLKNRIKTDRHNNSYMARRYETLLLEYEQLRGEVELASGSHRENKSLALVEDVERLAQQTLPELEALEKRHVEAFVVSLRQ